MALTYDSYVTSLANLIVVSSADTNFLTVLPNIIDDSEQRIYRECDFLRTIVVTSSVSLSSDTRGVTLPSTITCVVVESIDVLSTAAVPSRTPLVPSSKEWLNAVYPTATSSSSTAVPLYFAMLTDQTLLVAPTAGTTHDLEITATTRPTSLSSSNTTTYLSNNLPDLFIAASMVLANAYLKNFAATADDPQAPVTWEKHYMTLRDSAIQEEQRKKFYSQGGTSKQTSPGAQRT